jgi:hypothetical protein
MKETLRQRNDDPLIEALDTEFRKLSVARKMWGDDNTFVQELATRLAQRLEEAKRMQSFGSLLASMRQVNAELRTR